MLVMLLQLQVNRLDVLDRMDLIYDFIETPTSLPCLPTRAQWTKSKELTSYPFVRGLTGHTDGCLWFGSAGVEDHVANMTSGFLLPMESTTSVYRSNGDKNSI